MSLAAPNWKQWVSDFTHGRTHVAYGLIAGSVFSAAQVVISPTVEQRAFAVVILAACVGALVDTVAHLYYH